MYISTASLLAISASFSFSHALYQGFNYASTFIDGTAKTLQDFQNEFAAAKSLVGTSGFTSARLYTMIQAGTTDSPIAAIEAAVTEGTSLLLGMWASAGQGDFNNELNALNTAISSYGSKFTSLIAGISVGSEDLYRISPTGIAAREGDGPFGDPDSGFDWHPNWSCRYVHKSSSIDHLANCIDDTWTSYVNSSNNAVIAACDFLGMDAYPYFQNTMANSITNGKSLFFDALDATKAASMGKPVWITETGWPVSGPTQNQGVPSLQNAQEYWDQVGCEVFGSVNTWWYALQDAGPSVPSPSFGVVGATLSSTPLYNLTCPAIEASAPVSSTTTGASNSVASTTGTGAAGVPTAGSPGDSPFTTLSSESAATTPSGIASPSGNNSTTAGAGFTSTITTVLTNSAGSPTFTAIATTVSNVSVTTGAISASPSISTGGAMANKGSVGALIGAMVVVIASL
ncbi:MAG: hypothetical protein MMC33_006292 [Icmadophila ericetorum]|nr:hypothetical protein [Icmadophila ericetorum]